MMIGNKIKFLMKKFIFGFNFINLVVGWVRNCLKRKLWFVIGYMGDVYYMVRYS